MANKVEGNEGAELILLRWKDTSKEVSSIEFNNAQKPDQDKCHETSTHSNYVDVDLVLCDHFFKNLSACKCKHESHAHGYYVA